MKTPAPLLGDSLDEEGRAQLWATMALRHTRGLGGRSWTRLLKTFGSAYAALQNIPRWAEAGVTADKAAQVAAGSWRTTAREEWDATLRASAHLVMWHDTRYPQRLRELPDAPPLLYCRGDMALLSGPCLAIVGSRRCTPDGVRAASDIAGRLAACGLTIVSGMALGIDRVAHNAAMREIGKSIAVLGTGLDVPYPEKNRDVFLRMEEKGLVVTEFAPGTPPLAGNFPVRNRIISGLSLGVLVVEAAARSGSLITARLALEQNREVYAIPGAVFASSSFGCQELIRQGAHPVFSAEDIMRDLAPQLMAFGISHTQIPQEPALPDEVPELPTKNRDKGGEEAETSKVRGRPDIPLDGDAARVVRTLREQGKCHTDMLCQLLDIPIPRLSGLLVTLEMDGFVRHCPGAFYESSEM